MYKKVLLLISVVFILTSYSNFTSNAFAQTLTKDFDTRTKSSMTEEVYKEYFKGGLLENKYQIVTSTANSYGVNAGFVSSIMAHESTRGTSELITEFNNPGGLTCKEGSSGDGWTCEKRSRWWMKFDSIDIAIKYKIEYLQRVYHKSSPPRYSVYDIQQKYCPDSDADCSTTWVVNVLKHLSGLGEGEYDGLLASGDGNGESLDIEGTSGSVYDNPFYSYKEDISNVGVNDGTNYDTSYTSYKTNRYVGNIQDLFVVLTYAISILIGAYIFILWLAVLLARTHLEMAYQFVKKITFGFIDAHEDLGKLTITTILAVLLIVISLSGLLPKVFGLIYVLISKAITYIFRL